MKNKNNGEMNGQEIQSKVLRTKGMGDNGGEARIGKRNWKRKLRTGGYQVMG